MRCEVSARQTEAVLFGAGSEEAFSGAAGGRRKKRLGEHRELT